MNRIGRILCAVDFSPESHAAASYAAALSRALGAPMALVHSHHVPALAAYGRATTPDWEMWLPAPSDEGHELEMWVTEFRASGFDVQPLLFEGSPAGAMARNTQPDDLLILATHSRGEIERALLGSSAERIIRHARCPSIVVPHNCRLRAVSRVLVATDFSTASLRAARFACEFARLFKAEVSAVHVVAAEHLPYDEHFEVPEYLPAMMDAARADLKTALAPCGRIGASVRSGVPHREIVDAAIEANADLIAIGLHGHTPIEAAVLGATANRVLRHAPCPVLVTR